MLKSYLFAAPLALSLTASFAQAGQLTLDVTLPQQNVAEYHKPYVVAFLEDASGADVANVQLWYDVRKPNAGGTKYLKELHTWWRKGGKDLAVPADGITGATRAPGRQTVTLDPAQAFKGVKPGQYNLVFEASREQGGHDVVRVPVDYKPGHPVQAAAKGTSELGDIKVSLKP